MMVFPVYLLLVRLYPVSCMDEVIRELLTPLKGMGEACGYSSCVAPHKGYLNVHLVPHTHGELGQTQGFYSYYTGTDENFESTTKNMKQILDFTISELWARPSRKFTFSDYPYLFYWWSHRDETVRRMVYELIRQGRLNFVGGGWSMSDESCTSYHAIIDHYTYSLRKINGSFLDCGRPLVAWQTDAVGHSREFASLLAQMGFDGVFIAPVGYDEEVARLQRREMEFVWRGSDDLGAETDIFSHVLFDGMLPPPGFCFSSFCSDPLIVSSSSFMMHNVEERAREFINSMKNRQRPYYSTDNVLVMMGGRLAYSDASTWFENIDKLIQAVNSMADNNKVFVFYSTPACYLKAIYDEGPTLNTKQDDFYPQAIDASSYASGAYTSKPSIKHIVREGHRLLQITKQLHVTARLGDYGRFFEDFQWINGAMQDHHIITGEVRPLVKDFYVHKMDIAVQHAMLLLTDAFNKLRNSPISTNYYRCEFNISRCNNTSGPEPFIVVYNPLAWPVTFLVRLPIIDRQYIVYSPEGKRVPAATMPIPDAVLQMPGRNSSLDAELTFVAELPPLGFRSYYYKLDPSAWRRQKRSLIKKINQKKPKKYLVRQVNTSPEEETLFSEPEYEYFEEDRTTKAPHPLYDTKIVFGNVSRIDNSRLYADVLTPKSRLGSTEAVTRVTTENSSYVDVATWSYSGVMDERNYTSGALTSTTDRPTTKISTTRPTRTPHSTTRPPTTPTETPQPARRKTLDSGDLDDEEVADDPYWKGYSYIIEDVRPFIRNRHVRLNLDSKWQIVNVSISNGIKMPFGIQMVRYISDDPAALGKDMPAPGAYVFRSMDNKEEPILDSWKTRVVKNKLGQELHRWLAPYASFAVRLRMDSPVLEVDWVVGPIPVDDGLGKDIFIKYTTDLNNEGVFYTDSNGRQTIKRIRNRRPSYRALNTDPVAGNIYPVTSKIYIEDLKRNIRFSVLNDRSQGGSSFKDGEISLMLHRRLLTEDPIKEDMNETEFDQGVVIRGTHYLYFSKADYKPTHVFEKKLAKEIELRPQVFASGFYGYGRNSKDLWQSHTNVFTALKTKLPVGIHILTLQQWTPTSLLLRLENYLEKDDVVITGVKSVYLNNLFNNITFYNVQEMTLAANMLLKDWTPLDWKKHMFYKSFNEAYGNGTRDYSDDFVKGLEDVELDKAVVLSPQQIRTFLLTYVYNAPPQ